MQYIFSFIFALSILFAPSVVLAADTLESEWLSNHSSAEYVYSGAIQDYSINKYTKDYVNTFAYRFATGLVQLGYDIDWNTGRKAFDEFQKKEGLPHTYGVITSRDIWVLDQRLKEIEKDMVENVEDVLAGYPNLTISFPENCHHEPLIYYISALESTLDVFNEKQRAYLKDFTLECGKANSLGLGGGGTIIIYSSYLIDTDKFLGVFIHEMGHVVDSNIIAPVFSSPSAYSDQYETIYVNDPSIDFYKIAWVSSQKKNYGVDKYDFVSGYAMTNPFEDFSETITAYVQYGNNFRASLDSSIVLKSKYDYVKKNVFDGKEFDTGTHRALPRVWDVTESLSN